MFEYDNLNENSQFTRLFTDGQPSHGVKEVIVETLIAIFVHSSKGPTTKHGKVIPVAQDG